MLNFLFELITVVILFFGQSAKAQYSDKYEATPFTRSIIYNFAGAPTPTFVSQTIKERQWIKMYYSDINFDAYKSTRSSDGNITGNIFWTDVNGWVKCSPASSLLLPLFYSSGILSIAGSTLSFPTASPQTTIYPVFGINIIGSAPTYSLGIDTTKVITVYKMATNMAIKANISNVYTKSDCDINFMPIGYSAPSTTLSYNNGTVTCQPGGNTMVVPVQTIQADPAISITNTILTVGSRTTAIPIYTAGIISNITPTINGTGIAVVTGTGSSFNISVPANNASITSQGIATVTTVANNHTINVPAPDLSAYSTKAQADALYKPFSYTAPVYSVVAGTSISVSVNSNTFTVNNTAPHITSTVTGGGISTATMTSANVFSINVPTPAYTGSNVSITGTFPNLFFTNLAPEITPSITAINGLTVTSSSASFTVTQKRQDTYTGSTTTGTVTFTYSSAFTTTPNVQAQLGVGATNKETITPISSTSSGCSFLVELRADVLGILPTYSGVNARQVNILVTEK